VRDLRHLLRMKRLAQHPQSLTKVWIVLGVVAGCLVLFAIEHWFGWSDWLSVGRNRTIIVRYTPSLAEAEFDVLTAGFGTIQLSL